MAIFPFTSGSSDPIEGSARFDPTNPSATTTAPIPLEKLSRYKPVLILKIRARQLNLLQPGISGPAGPETKFVDLTKSVKSLTIKKSINQEDMGSLNIVFNVGSNQFMNREEFRNDVYIEPILGYPGRLIDMGTWKSTLITYNFPNKNAPTITMQAVSVQKGTLNEKFRTINWPGNIPEIIRSIEEDNNVNITTVPDDPELKRKFPIAQINKTDNKFLAELASYLGYVYIEREKEHNIYFGPVALLQDVFPQPLIYHKNKHNSSLNSFKVQSVTASQGKTHEDNVQNVDSKTGEAFKEEQSPKKNKSVNESVPSPGEKKSNLPSAEKRKELSETPDEQINNQSLSFSLEVIDDVKGVPEGSTRLSMTKHDKRVDQPVPSITKEDASKYARQVWKLDDFIIVGTAKTILLPELNIGQQLDIQGVSKFSGEYIITKLEHKYSDSGYETIIGVSTDPTLLNSGKESDEAKDDPAAIQNRLQVRVIDGDGFTVTEKVNHVADGEVRKDTDASKVATKPKNRKNRKTN